MPRHAADPALQKVRHEPFAGDFAIHQVTRAAEPRQNRMFADAPIASASNVINMGRRC